MSNLAQPTKVIVLCTNSNGEQEFHTCAPTVTPAQIEAGEHYTLAKENAEYNGYRSPMMAFDSRDAAGKQLSDVLAWLIWS